MTKEVLSSDRVNYLIWRYLQETNYRETAVKLQQEWNVQAPQALDFAPHVRHHALVTILNNGLRYHECEREVVQATRGPTAPHSGFFGPVNTQLPPTPEPAVVGADEEQEVANGRKRQNLDARAHLPSQNGASPTKRPKLSNGYENGGIADTATPMELDDNNNNDNIDDDRHGDSNAYPSPKEVDQPEAPVFTSGPEEGTQVEKVAELTAETTFLTLSEPSSPIASNGAVANGSNGTSALVSSLASSASEATAATAAGVVATTAASGAAHSNPVLLHCAWSPRDPTALAAAGTDALARLWTISRGISANAQSPGHVNVNGVAPPYRDLVAQQGLSKFSVTDMAWADDGAAIAIASDSSGGETAKVGIWGMDGMHIHTFDGFEPPVICLKWNPSSTFLLGLMPEEGGTCITVFHPSFRQTLSRHLPHHNMYQQPPLDVAWIADNEFVVCGGDVLLSYRCVESAIEQTRKFETRQDHGLVNVTYDWRTRLLATSTGKGTVDIWDQQGQNRSSINAHQSAIISVEWQPLLPGTMLNDEDERLLVTSGADGVINLWNIRGVETKPRSMTMEAPVVAIAFTPDGAFIAGATGERILIWKVEDVASPRASWTKGDEPGWKSPRGNGSTSVEDQHCLSWDANGQRLAYGVNNMVCYTWIEYIA